MPSVPPALRPKEVIMRSAEGPTKAPFALPTAAAVQVLQVPLRLSPEPLLNCAKLALPVALAFQVVPPAC